MITVLGPLLAGLTGGVVKGTTGFGFALVFVPALSLFLNPKAAVATSLLLGTMTDLIVLYEARADAPGRAILPMTVAGLLGAAVGAQVLRISSHASLKVLIGLVAVVLSIPIAAGVRWVVRREKLTSTAVGLAAGVLTAATGSGGPPVTLFLVSQGYAKNAFRARFSQYFAPVNLAAALQVGMAGVVNWQTLTLSLLLIPAIWLGIFIGGRLLRHLSADVFKKIALAFVMVIGLINLYQGVRGLIG